MTQDFSTVVIIGGWLGIGLATAQAAYRKGLRPTVIGRDGAKLADASELIGSLAASAVTDASDRAALDQSFASINRAGKSRRGVRRTRKSAPDRRSCCKLGGLA